MARLRLLVLVLCVAGSGQSGSAYPLARGSGPLQRKPNKTASAQKGKHPQNWKNCRSKVVSVGGATGWAFGIATSWTQPPIFAGDKLLFAWDPVLAGETTHFVALVPTARQYRACDFTGAKTLGSNNVTVNLKHSGTYYFACPTPGHCQAFNMKVAITVLPAKQCPVSAASGLRRRQNLALIRGRRQ